MRVAVSTATIVRMAEQDDSVLIAFGEFVKAQRALHEQIAGAPRA